MSPRQWQGTVETLWVREAYTPAVLTKIASALGTTLTPRLGAQITGTAQRLYGWWHQQNGPWPTEIRQTLTTLCQQAEELSQQIRATQAILEQLDDLNRLELSHGQCGARMAWQLLEETQQAMFQWTMQDTTTLRPFIEQIKTTLQQFPSPRSGRHKEWALQWFLWELATIYHNHTGKPVRLSRSGGKSYSGPLFRFICACVALLSPGDPSPR